MLSGAPKLHSICSTTAIQKRKNLQQQDITAQLSIDETTEWCNIFVLVPKLNGKVRPCLDSARLNHALIRLVHRGLTLNGIFPKLNNVQYLTLIDASSGYHNLKLDERPSYITTFTCQFGRYRYKRLPFGAAPAGGMFQRKLDEIFIDLPNIFSIADDILVVGYDIDGKDHDDTLHRVLQVCRQQGLFFGKIISKKNLQAFPGIINYFSKFSPSTAEICEALRQMTLVKMEWTCNADYQRLFN